MCIRDSMDPVTQNPLTVEQLQSIPRYEDLKIIEQGGNVVADSTKQRALRIWQYQNRYMSKGQIKKIYEQNTNK